MPERVRDFQGQSFHKLRRDCLRRGALFKDPLFPTTAQSLFYKREPPPGLTWKRPREICKDPRLFVDGISTRDLHQGSLGNCWMMAAISCLASEPSLWKRVIPDHVEQEWNPKRLDLYAGIFHFRFWRLGCWMDVVVDDRLPVSRDGVLLFCRSATPREFWSALLEKAYALNGCYEALEGGNTAEALIDFTGGVSEPLSLDREALTLHSDHRRTLFQTLAKAHECKALITCSIRPAEGEAVESVLDCGLVQGHAYGITAVRKVRLGEKSLKTGGVSKLFMVRMRNPWGTTDWTGAWSQSQQWQQMSRAEREKMGLIVRDVGEFMDFEDFCHYFTDVVVCRLVERALLWPSCHWREVHCYGEWAPAPTTPGSPPSTVLHGDFALTLGKNNVKPGGTEQRGNRKEARLGESQQEGRKRGRCERDKAVKKVMKEDDGGERNGGWEPQVDKRSRCGGCINHRETFLHNPQFMFEVGGKEEEVLICLQQEDRRIQRKDGGGENLPIGFEVLKVEVNRCSRVQCVVEQAASSVYMDSRSVTLRATLAPGRYVVLPTTFLPGATGRFLLRLFSHSHVRLPDVYATVRCENDTIRTRVFKAEGNPEFNLRTIFYRRYPDTHISVELWSRGLLWDSVLGVAQLQTAEAERSRSHVIDLRGGQSCSGYRGRIYVETSSSICLTDL
uniref:Calpain-5-like n=1 Tax=Seriola dumerili TaxID=41447 RepID=A0A3B4VFM8_SERDU